MFSVYHHYHHLPQIVSLYCLHWIHDQLSCLQNLHALLRPGGEALLVFLASNPLFATYESMSMEDRWAPYMKVGHG